MALAVGQRRHEIGGTHGHRRASGEILRMILGQGMALACSEWRSVCLARYGLRASCSSYFLIVAPTDPLTYVGVR